MMMNVWFNKLYPYNLFVIGCLMVLFVFMFVFVDDRMTLGYTGAKVVTYILDVE